MSGGFRGMAVWTHPETAGEIDCPMCGALAPVRRNKRGKLYYYCAPDAYEGREGCGMITPNLPGGQEWIEQHARLFASGETPPALQRMADAAARKQAETPAPKARPESSAPVEKAAGKTVNEKSAETKPRRGMFEGLI